MGLFNRFLKKDLLPEVTSENIVAMCDGEMIEPSKIEDKMFASETLGKTVGFIPTSNRFVAPCDGVLEVMFPTGHAFAIRMKDGTGILVHIGINTVDLNGKGFKVFAKQGDKVKAGEKILDVDLDLIKESGYCATSMLIITEPIDNKEYNFYPYGYKNKCEIIL